MAQANDYFIGNTTTNNPGWACYSCGGFVAPGTQHSCLGSMGAGPTWQLSVAPASYELELIAAIEKLTAAIERLLGEMP